MQQAEKLSKLNIFLENVKVKDKNFHLRLGANFPIISDLYHKLYSNSPYKEEAFESLLASLVKNFEERSVLQKKRDMTRVSSPNWYSSEKIVGMMLYVDLFNIDFNGLKEKIPYLLDLGINTVHLMPFLDVLLWRLFS